MDHSLPMSRHPRRRRAVVCLLVVAAAGPATGGGSAPDETLGGLADRMERLERRLERLEGRDVGFLDRARAEMVRGLIRSVLDDAGERTALRDGGLVAGWDGEFYLHDPDDRFRLEVSGQLQLRFASSHRRGADDTWGFENRRTKLKVDGHVVDPRLRYALQMAADRDGGEIELQDAYIDLELADDLFVRGGRYRTSLLREFDVSSKRQLAVERSLVARTFRQDRTIGASMRYEGERFGVAAALMDASEVPRGDDSWLVAVRVERALVGRLKPLRDFTSFPAIDDEDDDDLEPPVVALGGGVLFQDGESADAAVDNGEVFRWTVDLSYERPGVNAMVAYVFNRFQPDAGPVVHQWGAVAQAGAFVTSRVELFARYELGDADGVAPDLSLITIGFNRYWYEHTLKWTFDVGYGFNEVGGFWASSGAGWLEDEPGEDGQVVVRSQLQLLW